MQAFDFAIPAVAPRERADFQADLCWEPADLHAPAGSLDLAILHRETAPARPGAVLQRLLKRTAAVSFCLHALALLLAVWLGRGLAPSLDAPLPVVMVYLLPGPPAGPPGPAPAARPAGPPQARPEPPAPAPEPPQPEPETQTKPAVKPAPARPKPAKEAIAPRPRTAPPPAPAPEPAPARASAPGEVDDSASGGPVAAGLDRGGGPAGGGGDAGRAGVGGGSGGGGGGEGGGAGLQPPRPLRTPKPPYPSLARRQGVQGVVQARLTVDAQGRVTDVRILGARPPGYFEDAVREALADWRFHPADDGGRKAPAQVTTTVKFELD